MSLDNLRKEIDEIDSRLVELLARRVKIAENIGRKKVDMGQRIEDKEREMSVLEKAKELARKEGLDEADIEAIYQKVIALSRNRQGVSVAFQGEIGSYSEEAAFSFFGGHIQTRPYESLEEVFQAVEQDKVQFGIAPIENSLEGSIARTYDLLLESELKVCGELELKVAHCLIARQGATLDSIERIYSHPQALGQCQAFLKHLGCELTPTYDTAGSVKMIKEKAIADGAAIAGYRAAEIYGMEVLARDIQDNAYNFTRFFILAKEDSPPTGHDKTSVVFSVKHKPGALYNFLKDLTDNNINMTKIESRPTRQKPWEYNFYLDFEGHRQDKMAKEALEKLEASALFVKVLGSYTRAK
jgi:chorismate mutase/prephenate dehydratase